jgi:hypothetical protein
VGNQSHLATLASSQNRVLRGEGRPTLRSVDRECMGRVTEPRKIQCGCRLFSLVGRQYPTDATACPEGSAGVNERGTCTGGPPRNLGGPAVSTWSSGWGSHNPKNPGPHGGRRPKRERITGRRVVPRNEGNEVKREERQGVGAARSSEESGEPFQGTRRSKGAAGSWNRRRERRWMQ